MKEKFEKIYQMQTELNEKSKRSSRIEPNWGRCVRQEVAEAIDCFPWKHWKDVDSEIDTLNYFIELVDIYHFIVSAYIDDFPIILLEGNDSESYRREAFVTNSIAIYNIMNKYPPKREPAIEELLRNIEDIIQYTFRKYESDEISFENIDDIMKEQHRINLLYHQFAKVVYMSGYDFERLSTGYIAKNLLNQFRQTHGYAEGVYRKNWQGREDNHVLFEWLLNQDKVPSEKEIWSFLVNEYEKVER